MSLIVRKDHVLCTRCYEVIPVHPGSGTPLMTFVGALLAVQQKHTFCKPESLTKTKRKRSV